MDSIFFIAIIIMSVVVHEVAHGFIALKFGDKTALYAGRLTLNPIKHLDLYGSVIIPFFLVLVQSPFFFGWAKPVPYNPLNLTNRKWGTIAVASAGILANLFVAVFFGLAIRFGVGSIASVELVSFLGSIVAINIGLAIFNLVPIPPLDGSKILFSLLPSRFYNFMAFMEQYSIILILIFILFFTQYLFPIFNFLFKFITGLQF